MHQAADEHAIPGKSSLFTTVDGLRKFVPNQVFSASMQWKKKD